MVETLKASSSEYSDSDIDVIAKGVLRFPLAACPKAWAFALLESQGNMRAIQQHEFNLSCDGCSFT